MHLELEQKAIELRLGQRIRAFELDWILRRQNEKWIGQRVRFAHDGDASLLHRLEQRRLCFGRSAIDFVREHEIGKEGSMLKHELPASVELLQNRIARDVTRQQIGRELNPLRIELQR